MPWRYTALSNTLAGLYYRVNDIEALLIAAGFLPQQFVLVGSASTIWTLAIRKIENLNQVTDIINAALAEYPANPVLLSFLTNPNSGFNSVYSGAPPAGWNAGLSRKEFEKITGAQSTLLPVSFLEHGLIKSRSVARIITPDGMGTGFLISNSDLLLTNNHVIGERLVRGQIKIQFNYQQTVKSLAADAEIFEADTSVFYTSVEHDWTVIKVNGYPSAKYDFIELKPVSIKPRDYINIIQHPGGEYKQLAIYHNLVTYSDDNVVQYLTDTMPGSSGSPAFNSAWQVVALHHSGGWIEEPGGNGQPVLRNEGISIKAILADFEKQKIFL